MQAKHTVSVPFILWQKKLTSYWLMRYVRKIRRHSSVHYFNIHRTHTLLVLNLHVPLMKTIFRWVQFLTRQCLKSAYIMAHLQQAITTVRSPASKSDHSGILSPQRLSVNLISEWPAETKRWIPESGLGINLEDKSDNHPKGRHLRPVEYRYKILIDQG